MSKYRSNTHDAMKPVKTKATPKGVDALPSSRIPIYDTKGHMRGHVGHKASSATVSRFTGTNNNKLGKKNGRTAWLATLAEVSAQGTATPGSTADTLAGVSSKGATATQIKTAGG